MTTNRPIKTEDFAAVMYAHYDEMSRRPGLSREDRAFYQQRQAYYVALHQRAVPFGVIASQLPM